MHHPSILPLATLLAFAPLGAHAATLFSATYTGAEFASATTTGAASVSTSGTTATYDATADRAAIATLDLLAAGPRDDLTLTVTINYDRLSLDNDLGFGLTDGTTLLGAMIADNNNGQLFRLDGGPGALNSITTGIGVSQAVTASFTVLDNSGPATLDVTYGSTSVSNNAFNTTLDTDTALSFSLFADDDQESFRINSVSVDLSTPAPVPLPAGGALLLTGLVGLVSLRRRAAREI